VTFDTGSRHQPVPNVFFDFLLIFFCSLTFGTGSVHQPVPKDFFYFSFDFSVAVSVTLKV
jgi:hypothetical protein